MLTNRELNVFITKANAEYNKNGDSFEFRQICSCAMNHAKINQLVVFAQRVQGVDVKKFGTRVLKEGDAEQNFNFANIQGSDSRAHRDKIIATGDVEFNIKAGKYIDDEYRDEYVNKHGAIVSKGSAYENFQYLKLNKSSKLDKQPHFDKIIESKNLHINHICAMEIEDADVLAHGKVALASKSPIENMLFAQIEGADTLAHLDMVVRYGSARDNLDVMQQFPNCKLDMHIYKIFALKDNEVKYECIIWLKQHNLLDKYKNWIMIEKFVKDYKNGKIAVDMELISAK